MFTISVGMPGPFELMIVLAIVLILFGAGKLPKVLGQMGKGVKAFKEGLSGQGAAGEDAVDVTPEDGEEPQKAIDHEPEAAETVAHAEDAEEIESEDDQAQG
jgi:sec-independent protein translocase protein TatA